MALVVMACVCLHGADTADRQYDSIARITRDAPTGDVINAGQRYRKAGDLRRALIYFSIAAGRYRPDMDDAGRTRCVEAYLAMGSTYQYQTNFLDALDMYLKALDICDAIPGKPHIMELNTRIGLIYCNLEDYTTGLMFLRSGYALRHRYPDPALEENLLFDLTAYSALTGDVAAARRYHALTRRKNYPPGSTLYFRSIYNEGLIQSAAGEHEQAIASFRRALSHTAQPRLKSYVYERLHITFRQLNQPDSALHYLLATNRTARELNITALYLSSLRDLADHYAATDPGRSAAYRTRYTHLADSCYNRRDFDRLKTRQFTHALDAGRERISRLETLQAEKETRIRGQLWLIAVIVLGLITAVTLLVVVYRKKKALDASYGELYLSSRRALDAEAANERKCRAYEEEIAALQAAMTAVSTEKADDPPQRYCRSSLDRERKEQLAAAIRRMADNGALLNPELTLQKMADELGTNRQYVSQVLNEIYGKNFTDFINGHRVGEACRRIADIDTYGNYTMEGIGRSVGFRSQSTFFAAFKKATGLTPSVYRKMALRDNREHRP